MLLLRGVAKNKPHETRISLRLLILLLDFKFLILIDRCECFTRTLDWEAFNYLREITFIIKHVTRCLFIPEYHTHARTHRHTHTHTTQTYTQNGLRGVLERDRERLQLQRVTFALFTCLTLETIIVLLYKLRWKSGLYSGKMHMKCVNWLIKIAK